MCQRIPEALMSIDSLKQHGISVNMCKNGYSDGSVGEGKAAAGSHKETRRSPSDSQTGHLFYRMS